MTTLYLDIETDTKYSKIWYCCTIDGDTGDERTFTDGNRLTAYLDNFDCCVAHNGIGFDFPHLQRIWGIDFSGKVLLDTLIMSRLADPVRDGGHSLEGWGIKLNQHKGDFKNYDLGPNPAVLTYCQQDVRVLQSVHRKVITELKLFSKESIDLEHEVAKIIHEQEVNGMYVNRIKLQTLIAELDYKNSQIEGRLQSIFPARIETGRTHKTSGKPLNDIVTPFNPGSRQQIAERLIEKGWKPTKKTEKGSVIVDEDTLKDVKIPEAQAIMEYLMIQKRQAQTKSWLKELDDSDDNRIHGKVITIGAITGRMSHSKPNMAQVPAVRNPYGKECRELFCAEEDGWVLVDADLSGLELRCFAHYLGDNDYIKEVVNGDPHTRNQQAMKLQTRDQAKTALYALLYGAGAAKMGAVVGRGAAAGNKIIDNFKEALPAYAVLKTKVETIASSGKIEGIDGRQLHIRSAHAALNTLLQACGAVIAKKALVLLDRQLKKKYNGSYKIICNIHDEFLIECKKEIADDVGMWMVWSFEQAGRALKMKCPITGEYKIGQTWADVH